MRGNLNNFDVIKPDFSRCIEGQTEFDIGFAFGPHVSRRGEFIFQTAPAGGAGKGLFDRTEPGLSAAAEADLGGKSRRRCAGLSLHSKGRRDYE